MRRYSTHTSQAALWRLVAFIVMTLSSATAVNAFDFTAGGLYYNIMSITGTAQLTSGDTPYSGTVTIPATVTNGDRTYRVTAIDANAFAGCAGLTSVTLGENVESIGNRAFLNCTGLTTMKITAAVTTIGDYAFAWCSNLTNVKFYNAVPVEIGAGAFLQCTSLASVSWPSAMQLEGQGGISILGTNAFAHCTSLNNVKLPGDFQFMGTSIFTGCDNLTNIGLTSFTPFKLNGDPLDLDPSVVIYVPSSGTSGETAALYRAAAGWRNYTIVEMLYSFIDNSNYTYLKNPGTSTVTLTGCLSSNLEDVTVRSTITHTDGSTLKVTAIADGAFKARHIKTFDTSNAQHLKHIGSEALSQCTELTTVGLREGITTMGERAFAQCSSLTTVQLPSTLHEIPDGAFEYCTSLSNVSLVMGISSLGHNAFAHCTSLTSIALPRSIAAISTHAFSGDTSLESISVDPLCSNYASADGVLFERKHGEDFEPYEIGLMHKMIIYPMCKTSESYHIPNGVTTIDDNAMAGAQHLKYLAIPGTTTTFGQNCFDGTNIETINYRNLNPSNDGTTGLTAAVKARATLQVPVGTTEQYAALNSWQGFKNVVEIDHVMQDQQFAYDWCNNYGVTVVNILASAVDSNGTLTIPNQVMMSGYNYYVKGLSDNCTQQVGQSVQHLVIEADSLASFGASNGINPLAQMRNLQSLTLAPGNTYFKINDGVLYDKQGTNLYYYLPSLTQAQFTIPSNVTTIMPQAFAWNTHLTHVTFNATLKQVGDGAFEECSALRHIYNAKGVNSIGNRAFALCKALKDFNGGERLNHIGNEAFLSCYNLRMFPLAHGMLKSIGSRAFMSCGSLKIVAMGLNLSSVGDRAFEYCPALEKVFFPTQVDTLGIKMFKGCTALNEMWLGNEAPPSVGNEFFDPASLPSLNIYVPQPSNYRNVAPWSSASSINSCQYLIDGPDVNGDRVINAADVTIIMSALLGDLDGEMVGHLDVNHDGVITATDVTVIYDYILNGAGTNMAYKFVQEGNSNLGSNLKQGTTTRVMAVNQSISQYVTAGLTGHIDNTAVATITQGTTASGVPYLDITAVAPGYFTLVAIVSDGNTCHYRAFPITVTQ